MRLTVFGRWVVSHATLLVQHLDPSLSRVPRLQHAQRKIPQKEVEGGQKYQCPRGMFQIPVLMTGISQTWVNFQK